MRDDYPEAGEFVLGTVENIFNQGAFIVLDEYNGKRGMLHIREISLKWVRNIHDYVKKSQKVVLMVLRVDPDKGHIDFSLRRVTDAQRKEKLQEVKQRQRSEKLMEMVANDLGVKPGIVLEKVSKKILEDYESLYDGLEAIAGDENIADGLNIDDKWKSILVEHVKNNIKAPEVEITSYVELRCYGTGGVEEIKKALSLIKENNGECKVDVNYQSAPLYRINIKGPDYKTAERFLKECVDKGLEYIKKHDGEGEFHRERKK